MRVIVFLCFLSGLIMPVKADYAKAGRYTSVSITPTQEQLDPLLVIIDFTFPKQISKVGNALYLITSASGYRFNLEDQDITYILFNFPLPEVHKHLGPITLKDAIKTLAGKGFNPSFNDSLRTISFSSKSSSINSIDVASYKEAWLKTKSGINHKNSPIIAKYNNITNYTVKPGDSISQILINLGVGYNERLVDNIIEMNPRAFINNNPNQLVSGATIGVPLS